MLLLLADSRRVQQGQMEEVLVQTARSPQVFDQLQTQVALPAQRMAIAHPDLTLLGGSPCFMGTMEGVRLTYQVIGG